MCKQIIYHRFSHFNQRNHLKTMKIYYSSIIKMNKTILIILVIIVITEVIISIIIFLKLQSVIWKNVYLFLA